MAIIRVADHNRVDKTCLGILFARLHILDASLMVMPKMGLARRL